MRHASEPVSIAPLRLDSLVKQFERPWEEDQSTAFSYTRYLVPFLTGYRGWAIFMDCDMLVRTDIAELWELADDRYAIQCVKHEHVPEEHYKFLYRRQVRYPRKNWSSVMLMNCGRLRMLTPKYVSEASKEEIKQLRFLDDEEIGALPPPWNHLVGYQEPREDANIVHYTIGGPYFHEYARCEYALDWFIERDLMVHAKQRRWRHGGAERPEHLDQGL